MGRHGEEIRIGGKAVHVRDVGEGPAVLLIHGIGAASHVFDPLIERHHHRFRFLAPDLPCTGRSQAYARPRADSLAQAMVELLDRLKIDRAVVLGHSYGGVVAIELAHRHRDRLDGLVVASPTGSTGYSFSAGGPILDPLSRNLIVTPIAAYLAALGSVVVSPEQVVQCRVVQAHEALVAIDGREDFDLRVGDAAVLLTRVVAVKARWAFLDASRNFVPESLVFARRSFVPTRADGPLRTWNLAGCTLSGGDVLALKVRLPRLARNDVLVMLDAGAYTVSKASRFSTCVPPAYAILESGSVTLVRPSEDDHEVA